MGLWRLVCGTPAADIISSALDAAGARVVLDHARTIVRRDASLAEAIDVQANALYYSAAESRWSITSREHTASRGHHPDVVIMDEADWLKDAELFASLLAAQASVACNVPLWQGRQPAGAEIRPFRCRCPHIPSCRLV